MSEICECIVNSSGARDGIFRLILSIPCLLIPWLLKSSGHQHDWYWQYRIGSRLWIWSYVEQNPRYNTKCECSFYNSEKNSACYELICFCELKYRHSVESHALATEHNSNRSEILPGITMVTWALWCLIPSTIRFFVQLLVQTKTPFH